MKVGIALRQHFFMCSKVGSHKQQLGVVKAHGNGHGTLVAQHVAHPWVVNNLVCKTMQ